MRTNTRLFVFALLGCGACGHIGPGLEARTYSNRSWGTSNSSSNSSAPGYTDPTDSNGNFKPVEGSDSSQRNHNAKPK